jgi:hypothetical protein
MSRRYPWSSIVQRNYEFYGRFDEFLPHHIVNVKPGDEELPAVSWTASRAIRSIAIRLPKALRRLKPNSNGRIDGQISGTVDAAGLKSTDGVELCGRCGADRL